MSGGRPECIARLFLRSHPLPCRSLLSDPQVLAVFALHTDNSTQVTAGRCASAWGLSARSPHQPPWCLTVPPKSLLTATSPAGPGIPQGRPDARQPRHDAQPAGRPGGQGGCLLAGCPGLPGRTHCAASSCTCRLPRCLACLLAPAPHRGIRCCCVLGGRDQCGRHCG